MATTINRIRIYGVHFLFTLKYLDKNRQKFTGKKVSSSLSSYEPFNLSTYICTLMAESRTVAFHTLGCKLNFSESSSLSRMLENEGFEKKEFDDLADVYVINTCSVTENADKECRQLVRRIQRKAPESLVVITGCYAQLKPKEISKIPGVNLVLGAAEKFNIAKHLREPVSYTHL